MLLSVIWYITDRESMTFALVVFGVMTFALVFSFLNYVTVGRYREAAEHRFYDAIYYACDFNSEFNGGREMKKIKVEWSGLKVKRVTVLATTNSNASKSSKEWRSVKLAVSDSFKITGTQVVAILQNQSKGQLEFVAVTDEQVAPGGEHSAAAFEENFIAFVYEAFSSYGTPLPKLRCFELEEDGRRKPRIKRFDVVLYDTPSSYERSNFEKNLKERYASSAKVWVFDWTEDGVSVEAIASGSDKEKRVLASGSIIDLVSSAVSSSFNWYGKGHVCNAKMIRWSKDHIPMSITVDFLQNDVSSENRIEDFENHVRRGLSQIYSGIKFDFDWNITAEEKLLTIRST